MIADFPLVKNMNPTEAQRGEVLLVCLKSYLFELLFLIEKGTEALRGEVTWSRSPCEWQSEWQSSKPQLSHTSV